MNLFTKSKIYYKKKTSFEFIESVFRWTQALVRIRKKPFISYRYIFNINQWNCCHEFLLCVKCPSYFLDFLYYQNSFSGLLGDFPYFYFHMSRLH